MKTVLVEQIIKVDGKEVFNNQGLFGKNHPPLLKVPSDVIVPYINDAIEEKELEQREETASAVDTIVMQQEDEKDRFIEIGERLIERNLICSVSPIYREQVTMSTHTYYFEVELSTGKKYYISRGDLKAQRKRLITMLKEKVA